MTKQKTFKHRVRDRMAKTGESYTAARRVLIARSGRSDGAPADFEPSFSDERLRQATGRGWDEWFALLDSWGATERSHAEIARWLREAHGVGGWWSQAVTVNYEVARGLRVRGQRDDGWGASASKTVAVPVERLFAAFHDPQLRERWLPGGPLRLRTATPPRSARFDWQDGATRVAAGFSAVADGKSRVGLEHERLPDAEAAEAMKAFWRERLSELKRLLESA